MAQQALGTKVLYILRRFYRPSTRSLCFSCKPYSMGKPHLSFCYPPASKAALFHDLYQRRHRLDSKYQSSFSWATPFRSYSAPVSCNCGAAYIPGLSRVCCGFGQAFRRPVCLSVSKQKLSFLGFPCSKARGFSISLKGFRIAIF